MNNEYDYNDDSIMDYENEWLITLSKDFDKFFEIERFNNIVEKDFYL